MSSSSASSSSAWLIFDALARMPARGREASSRGHYLDLVGAGGRTRRATDTAERARSTVTQRIRVAIRRIEQVHPALGRHLRASIATGSYCSYQPERAVRWVVDAGVATVDDGHRSVP